MAIVREIARKSTSHRPAPDGDPLAVHAGRRPGATAFRLCPYVKERPDRHAALDRELKSLEPAVRPGGEAHRLEQRRGDDPLVGNPRLRPLVVLLDEAPAADLIGAEPLELGLQAKQVQPPAAETELVVDYFRRNALIRTSYCWASRAYTP
jgi:hypothetical protein